MLFFEQLAVDIVMMVYHAQSALNGEVIAAENIGTPQAEKQNHLCRPDAYTIQTITAKISFIPPLDIARIHAEIPAERAVEERFRIISDPPYHLRHRQL